MKKTLLKRGKPPSRRGKSEMARAKANCWTWCSRFNRLKDVDEEGYGVCPSCERRIHWTKGDAGHFKDGRNNSILFYDNGIHLQCKTCNGGLKIGDTKTDVRTIKENYKNFLVKKYGEGEVKKIEKLSKETVQFTVEELKWKAKEYQEKVEAIYEDKPNFLTQT